MARKKTEISYIASSSKRKATFKKRTTGFVKKIEELCVFCDIDAIVIIYTRNKAEPEIVWPSDKEQVQNVISKYKEKSELEQSQRMFNQETLLKGRISKAEERLKKIRQENRKEELNLHMFQYFFKAKSIFDDANIVDLNDILYLTNQKLEQVKRKIAVMKAQGVTQVAGNGGVTMTQGEQAPVNHVQGSETNLWMP